MKWLQAIALSGLVLTATSQEERQQHLDPLAAVGAATRFSRSAATTKEVPAWLQKPPYWCVSSQSC